MSIILAIHLLVNVEDINLLYKDIVRELGESYIWHNYISMALGILLNIVGIFVGFFRPKKLILQ